MCAARPCSSFVRVVDLQRAARRGFDRKDVPVQFLLVVFVINTTKAYRERSPARASARRTDLFS